MKLMICGKGGSGKSTITALLARQYAIAGKRAVVVDTDVSNRGLHRLLGTVVPQDFIGYFGGKKNVMETMKTARQNNLPRGTPVLGTWTYDTIPTEYSSKNNGVKLVSTGKIHDATESRKGFWFAIARQFLAGLTLSEQDRVIVDVEAGIEHFGHKFGGTCDAILVVVDPAYESISLATTISRMVEPENVPLYIVLNKTSTNSSRALRNLFPDPTRIIGEFPQDRAILEAGFEGKPLSAGYPPATALMETIERMRHSLMLQAGRRNAQAPHEIDDEERVRTV